VLSTPMIVLGMVLLVLAWRDGKPREVTA